MYLSEPTLSPSDDEHGYLCHLEEELRGAASANGTGELDGHEIGPKGTKLYLYGADAELLFAAIEGVLIRHARGSVRVVLRYGGPGSPQKNVLFRRATPTIRWTT